MAFEKLKKFIGYSSKVENTDNMEEKSFRKLGNMPVQHGSFLEFALGLRLGLRGFTSLPNYQAMTFYRQSSAVSSAVDTIADEIEMIKPVLQTEDGKLTSDHEVLRLLRNPNDYEMWADFIGAAARSYLITGDTYFFAGGLINRPPVSLFTEKPQNINTIEAINTYVHSFNVYRGMAKGSYTRERVPNKGIRYYDGNMRELFPIMRYSSRYSNTKGDSPLIAAALEVAQTVLARVHNVNVLDNGGRLSLVVQFKDTTSDDQHQERAKKIREQLSGTGNAGKIAVISSADMEIEEFGKSNKDMDFFNLDMIARQSIFTRYKVPLPLVSMEASTFNNMSQAVYHLYDFAVLPLYMRLMSGLTRLLLPRYGLDPNRFSLSYNIEEIEALKMRRVEQLQARKELGVETINEIREGLPNREPLEGGDILYQGANLVPIGKDLFTEDNTTTEEELEQLATAQEETEEDETQIAEE